MKVTQKGRFYKNRAIELIGLATLVLFFGTTLEVQAQKELPEVRILASPSFLSLDKLARVLGPRRALLMKMHGAVIVGSSVEEAFVFALHLEENAEKQLWAEASGTVVSMTPNEVEESLSVAFGKSSIEKRWQYYREKEKMAMQRGR